jgi:hypothetical protein
MNGEEAGLSKWAFQLLWAPFLALIALVWKQQQATFKGQVDAATAAVKSQGEAQSQALMRHALDDERQFESVHEELQTQRGHIGKLFDQMRDESRRSEERHRELMSRADDGHRQLLMALNSKVDK